MLCVPSVRADVLKTAPAPAMLLEPSCASPSRNETVPVGEDAGDVTQVCELNGVLDERGIGSGGERHGRSCRHDGERHGRDPVGVVLAVVGVKRCGELVLSGHEQDAGRRIVGDLPSTVATVFSCLLDNGVP